MLTYLITYLGDQFLQGYRIFEKVYNPETGNNILVLSLM
jgi:hypothetical protein